jgi:hypothetical protein
MSRNASPPIVTVDPLPGLVEGRFRILNGGQNDRGAVERRLDEALRRGWTSKLCEPWQARPRAFSLSFGCFLFSTTRARTAKVAVAHC